MARVDEMDEAIQTFCSFTGGTPEQAQRYLSLTDGNVEQAAELFFTSPDLGAPTATPSQPPPQSSRDDPITIDDDEDDVQEMIGRAAGASSMEDDEAMARRLQEEMYGSSGGGGGGGGAAGALDDEGVRAPMARTTETLVGPGSNWHGDDDETEMRAAVAEQMMARNRQRGQGRPGIFNQRDTASIWTEESAADPEARRQMLSRATGGASDQSAKSNLLADLFRPPHDLIAHLTWAAARDEGKENEKWILVNVQDPSIFDCQVLNRDIWKNQSIRDTVKEHFIFLQYNKNDRAGNEYMQYYFNATMSENEDNYPHIAIVDPRTGEQVKTWSGSPAPKAADFLMDLHEFLDRYSLSMSQKNPVQTKRKEKKKDVAAMSEEEQLQMAMQQSMDNGGSAREEDDPDALTRPSDATDGKGKAAVTDDDAIDTSGTGLSANGTAQRDTPFAQISSSSPHEEPSSTSPTETTRIQFRYSGGRIVRRFLLSDQVRRIYEWLKAAPFEGKENASFELISMGKNLIESLDLSIGEAGLKNGTVMVEFIEDE